MACGYSAVPSPQRGDTSPAGNDKGLLVNRAWARRVTPYSYFSLFMGSKSGMVNGFWYLAEPLGVAVIALAAVGLVLAARNMAAAWWLGTGMVVAFGIQTLLDVIPNQFAGGLQARMMNRR